MIDGVEDIDPAAEDDEDDTEDEGGDDQAALTLETPESAQAIAAALKATKIKKPGKGKVDAKAKALGLAISDKALGLGESSETKPAETDQNPDAQKLSAYDSDMITDPEMDDTIDPLTAMLGAQEKPWTNEKLSTVETMMMNQGYQRHAVQDPAETSVDITKSKQSAMMRAAQITLAATAGIATMAAGVVLEPRVNMSPATPSKPTPQTHNQIRAALTTAPITVQARQNADDVTLPRMTRGLAPSVTVAQPTISSDQLDHKKRDDDLDQLDMQNNAASDPIDWSPSQDPDFGLRQAIGLIYTAMGTDVLMNVSPYRQAGWDEKRAEQQENAQDLTAPPVAPKAPDMAETLDFRRDMQLNLGPSGPG